MPKRHYDLSKTIDLMIMVFTYEKCHNTKNLCTLSILSLNHLARNRGNGDKLHSIPTNLLRLQTLILTLILLILTLTPLLGFKVDGNMVKMHFCEDHEVLRREKKTRLLISSFAQLPRCQIKLDLKNNRIFINIGQFNEILVKNQLSQFCLRFRENT